MHRYSHSHKDGDAVLREADAVPVREGAATADLRAADADLRGLSGLIDGWQKDGFVTEARATAWKQEMSAKKLSLVRGTGELDKVLTQIEHTKELIKDGVLVSKQALLGQRTGMGAAQEPAPEHVNFSLGDGKNIPAERVKAILDEKYGKR